MILIKKGLNFLTSIKPLYELHKRCMKADGHTLKTYWYLLEKRFHDRNNQLDFLAYKNNQLIGALQIYFFIDSIEITAMVTPLHRRTGVFKKMLLKALENLKNQNILHCILISNEKSILLNNQFQNWGGHLKYSISEWLAPYDTADLQSAPLITIEKAIIDDVKTIVEINHLCFPLSSQSNLKERFMHDVQESNRQIYIGRNEEYHVVGKLHVREEQERVVIHEVGIIPAFQKKGFGRSLMLNWLKHYAKQYNKKPIIVEVLNQNEAGISLYLSCGFVKQNSFNYYEFTLTDLYQAIV